ncbi:MAG: hypothetical protein E7314_06165 [Clostridiales bacterium]|nr:hypothetical protein [Clostridiales bacterium]
MKIFVCLSATVAGGKNITDIAEYIGEGNHTLIYGGGKRGAMGEISSYLTINYPSVLQFVYTIPAYSFDVPKHVSFVKVCENLTERLTEMIEATDVAIICPGGIGTAQELMTVIEWSRTERKVPIVIINEDGHYNWFINLIDSWITTGYASDNLKDYFIVVDKFDDAVEYLNNLKA